MSKILKVGFYFLFLLAFAFSVQAAEKIDINTAPLEDLIKIIHIGEVRALELISLRPFSSLDDLIRINGISKKRIEDIKKQGLAWVSVQEELELKNQLAEDGSPQDSNYPEGIVINEILPSPEGPDSEEEWIEIFNENDFEVDISGWKITDTTGKTKIYIFPEGTKIEAKGFLILPRPTTKITLNNDGDGLKLIQPDGKVINEVNYEKAPLSQSYNRTESGWIWTDNLTPGVENVISKEISEKEKSQKSANGKEVTTNNESFWRNQDKQIPKSSFPLSTALAIGTFSGIIILILKRRLVSLKKNSEEFG